MSATETLVRLRREVKRIDYACCECGKKDLRQWAPDKARDLAEKQLCFDCDYWLTWIASGDEYCGHRILRIDGVHFVAWAEDSQSNMRGYGGREFQYRMLAFPGDEDDDTFVFSTRNLWCQGEIPYRFRDRLPDNARWEFTGPPRPSIPIQ